MRCPFCAHEDTQVAETRESDEGDVIRRRRRCPSCDKRFTTYERAELAMPAVVNIYTARVDRSRSRESGGTGLGLAIVKHVMQRHGGSLSISSELGQGSRFRLNFPAARWSLDD
mgnify:CR=1 FL=1